MYTTSKDDSETNNFGFFRVLFASLVIISHSIILIDGNLSNDPLKRIFGTLSFGEVAVDGFFLISGYLITKSYIESLSVCHYLGKRVLRIYPGFIAAYLFSIFVAGSLGGGSFEQSSWWKILIVMTILGEPSLIGSFSGLRYPDLNGSMWTIAYEFRCYLFLILISPLLKKTERKYFAVFLVCFALLYAGRNYLPDVPYVYKLFGATAATIRLTFIFVIGGAFYVWRDKLTFSNRGALLAAGVLTGLFFVESIAELALAVFGGYLMFWYTFACPANIVSRKMHVFDPSYGIYLYAWPIQNLLIFHNSSMTPWEVTGITFIIVIIIGLLSWYFVEKPALRRKDLFNRSCSQAVDRIKLSINRYS